MGLNLGLRLQLGDNRPMSANSAMSATSAMSRPASLAVAAWGLLLCLAGPGVYAQDGSRAVYRCPGPPVLYTDAVTVQEAKDKGCRTIEGAPVTIVQTPARAPRPVAASTGSTVAGAGNPAGAAPAARSADSRIDPNAQRLRDTDARRILSEELRADEERLATLQREYNNGEPERRGDERNFQRYADRVAEMKAGILRKEADIAALRRELAKLPP